MKPILKPNGLLYSSSGDIYFAGGIKSKWAVAKLPLISIPSYPTFYKTISLISSVNIRAVAFSLVLDPAKDLIYVGGQYPSINDVRIGAITALSMTNGDVNWHIGYE